MEDQINNINSNISNINISSTVIPPAIIPSYNSSCNSTENIQVFNFTDPNSIISKVTFPNKCSLNNILYENQFNRLLQLIKVYINSASVENINYIRILNSQTTQYTSNIISNVKSFLKNKDYIIIDIEDINSNSIGWKLSW